MMDYSKMKVAELKERLESLGLSSKGLKKELVDRLEEHYDRSKPVGDDEMEVAVNSETRSTTDSSTRRRSPSPAKSEKIKTEMAMVEEHSDNADEKAAEPGSKRKATVEENEDKQPTKKTKTAEITESTTQTVLVKNLVRPFTVQALKQLTNQYGQMDNFWIDSIKTHCCLTYSSRESAANAQLNLHGLQWPEHTGRHLTAEFISSDQCETVMRQDTRRPSIKPNLSAINSSSSTTITTTTTASPPALITGMRSLFARATKAAVDSTVKDHQQALAQHHQKQQEQEQEQKQKSLSEEAEQKESLVLREDFVPAPNMPNIDLLFRKTVMAKPTIYYLPLTDEQVAAKKKLLSAVQ